MKCSFRRNPSFLAVLLLLTPPVVSAQVATAGASLHRAGPDSLYVDGVRIDGVALGFTIRRMPDGRWSVSEPVPAESGELPRGVVLDFARVETRSATEFVVSDVLLGRQFYSGKIEVNVDGSQVVAYEFEPSDPPLPEDNELLADLLDIYRDTVARISDVRDSDGSAAPEAPLTPEPPPPESDPDAPVVRPGSGAAPDAPIEAPEEPAAGGTTDTRLEVEPAAPRPPQTAADGTDRVIELLQRYTAAVEGELASLSAQMNAQSQRLGRLEEQVTELVALAREIEAGAVTHRGGAAGAAGRVPLDVSAFSPTVSLEAARALLGPAVPVDLTRAEAVTGDWRLSRSRAVQDDPDAFYAKLRLPFEQDATPRHYRFLASSLDPGWVGLGLHFAVESVERPAGYGHGESILVWLTRDPATYGVSDTFVEVYISYDDVNMERVAQARSPSRLAERTALEILFDPAAGFLTIAVNGVEYLRYRLTLPPGASAELTVRTLGRAMVEDLEVRSLATR